MIEIMSMRYSIDWAYPEKHEINPEKIQGFELHWRCSSWHVVVVESYDPEKGRKYDLSHWVDASNIIALINNPEAKILKIVNYHNSSNFCEGVERIFKQASIDKHNSRKRS